MNLKGRDLLSIADLSREELLFLVKETGRLKDLQRRGEFFRPLKNRVVGLLFEKPSTRTRCGFQTAVYQLGGEAVYMRPEELQASRGEPVKDTARVLGSYLDCIVIRTYSQGYLEEFARYSDAPVVNALSDQEHPTQVISDLYTMLEAKGRLEGVNLTWIGDGNNVCNSLLLACGLAGVNLKVSCPEGYDPDRRFVEKALNFARESGAEIELVRDPREAVADADFVYTDTWISIGQEKEAEAKIKAFKGYQVNDELLALAKDDTLVMHCLPAYRGKEITDSVLEGERSIAWEQSKNKLHGAKAVLASIL
ncbi:ornithine carbamoyltransferase [Candidatus Bathyarchaeota archaeon]|nr:MAG: ornithine carbamoyltransferase [Candidatus Bathyarchaeota archaeon]